MSHWWILPIWPNLHFGCATTLPPIQKNSSASLEMDAFCQSFGELIMDWVEEFKGLEACLAWWRELLASEGENTPADRDPKDWKLVVLGDIENSGGLPPNPGDRGAIAGVLLIPELYIWVRLSCPIHTAWTHLPLSLLGSSAKFVYSTAPHMQILRCQHVLFFQLKSSDMGSRNNLPNLKVHFLSYCVHWSSVAAIDSSEFFFFAPREDSQRKRVQHVSDTKSSSSCNPGVTSALFSWRDFHATSKPLKKESRTLCKYLFN